MPQLLLVRRREHLFDRQDLPHGHVLLGAKVVLALDLRVQLLGLLVKPLSLVLHVTELLEVPVVQLDLLWREVHAVVGHVGQGRLQHGVVPLGAVAGEGPEAELAVDVLGVEGLRVPALGRLPLHDLRQGRAPLRRLAVQPLELPLDQLLQLLLKMLRVVVPGVRVQAPVHKLPRLLVHLHLPRRDCGAEQSLVVVRAQLQGALRVAEGPLPLLHAQRHLGAV
mmetsp:Transcript_80974/g.212583  ORF Transcript_80974/g.212583 Transcript_80974/m.212583 type:complete len:223 (-) Transcript_80974:505-1173(-)